MAALTCFFEARQGRLFGFRFRDFADFKSCAPGAVPEATDQALGVGDGEQARFQLIKAYGETVRPIVKPVEGSVRVALDGVETESFEVDRVSGVVTLDEVPDEGVAVSAGYEFDTPVRFDADRIEVTLESFGAGRMVAMPLIEVRV